MFGLTTLGAFHAAIALVAVTGGFIALSRDVAISSRDPAGSVFLWGTIITCLTAFGIFQHGGFGVPHVFAIVTLVVLGMAMAAERAAPFGSASPYIATLGYSFALFLHFVPATVETLTRLPAGASYLSHPEDPKAQPIIGLFFLVLLAGAALQIMRMRREGRPASRAATAL